MKKIMMVFTAAILMVACASSTWDNMSSSDILTWRELGVGVDQANELNEEGIYAKEYGEWQSVGIVELDDILDWKEEKFKATEAGRWNKANFEVDEAVDFRAKGLQPIYRPAPMKSK